MDKEEEKKMLLDKLETIAARWREQPWISNDFAEGAACGEILDKLKNDHGIEADIYSKVPSECDYRVHIGERKPKA